jgi:hypothetical protein
MRIQVRTLTRAAIFLGLALAIQLTGLQQAIVGPGVNAVLLLATAMVGPVAGALIGITTPWIALLLGILKFAPALPVIIAGNLTLVLVFHLLRKVNVYAGAVGAAVAKYAVMAAGIKVLVATAVRVPPAVVIALTITQLWTALGGAAVALLVLKSSEIWARGRR